MRKHWVGIQNISGQRRKGAGEKGSQISEVRMGEILVVEEEQGINMAIKPLLGDSETTGC